MVISKTVGINSKNRIDHIYFKNAEFVLLHVAVINSHLG